MKKKLIVIWSLMLTIGNIPMSCDFFCRNSCGCKPLLPQEFSIKDFDIGDFVIGPSTFNPSNFYAKDQYFKTLNIVGFEYLSDHRESKMGFHLISVAYACSPIPPYSVQRIVELKIINKKESILSDNNLIMVDQDISEKFLISDYPTISGESFTSFIEKEKSFYMGEPFYIRWDESIPNETELHFDILFILSDGQEYFFEDEIMKIR